LLIAGYDTIMIYTSKKRQTILWVYGKRKMRAAADQHGKDAESQ
jgi:hypothetical protein